MRKENNMSIVLGALLMFVLYVRRFKSAFDEENRNLFFTATLIVFIISMFLFWLSHRA